MFASVEYDKTERVKENYNDWCQDSVCEIKQRTPKEQDRKSIFRQTVL